MTDGWTAAERDALAGLEREGTPAPSLEARTVAALRRQGLLAYPRRRAIAPGWVAAAIAASLACFLGGLAVGQQLGGRQTAELAVQLRAADAQQMASVVQQTGSAYVAALAALGMAADTASAASVTVGREVALNGLWAAAEEVLRLAPDDPVARGIVAAFEAERQAADAGRVPAGGTRRVVWF